MATISATTRSPTGHPLDVGPRSNHAPSRAGVGGWHQHRARAPGADTTATGPQRRPPSRKEPAMAKRGNKRRARKKNKANHGKRPNA
ncbi:hypothetical protein GCM10027047_07340 [Rhodococcus aerolatus]